MSRPRAKDIRDKVGEGIMPPWHADTAHGKFVNDRSLTEEEKTVLVRWANNGAPKGDPKDMPPAPQYPDGWSLGKPDVVLQMPVDYKVPADGFVEYEYFEIPTNFTEDKWVQSHRGAAWRTRRRASRDRYRAPAAAGTAARPGSAGARHGNPARRRPATVPARTRGSKHGKGQSLFPRRSGSGSFIGGFAPGNERDRSSSRAPQC